MLELLIYIRETIKKSYYSIEGALADLYDGEGCFCQDSVLMEALGVLSDGTGKSYADIVELVYAS
jgi:hypothetical protein